MEEPFNDIREVRHGDKRRSYAAVVKGISDGRKQSSTGKRECGGDETGKEIVGEWLLDEKSKKYLNLCMSEKEEDKDEEWGVEETWIKETEKAEIRKQKTTEVDGNSINAGGEFTGKVDGVEAAGVGKMTDTVEGDEQPKCMGSEEN
ncbi:hypothetical protein L6452_02766 [Arctium lappa]|uniref:Uncharacterized protein n=1 Tax=Arctium lappa TaxID=4217 RepID=A0ACB9FKC1_ARCLA|nr:hypothetical protein L6452_02766 [Arctium lappa]